MGASHWRSDQEFGTMPSNTVFSRIYEQMVESDNQTFSVLQTVHDLLIHCVDRREYQLVGISERLVTVRIA